MCHWVTAHQVQKLPWKNTIAETSLGSPLSEVKGLFPLWRPNFGMVSQDTCTLHTKEANTSTPTQQHLEHKELTKASLRREEASNSIMHMERRSFKSEDVGAAHINILMLKSTLANFLGAFATAEWVLKMPIPTKQQVLENLQYFFIG